MVVAISGCREIADGNAVAAAIEKSGYKITALNHGGCRGVDALAGVWAAERGIAARVFTAEWRRYGRGAGIIRARAMIDRSEALIAVFKAGEKCSGTAAAVEYAKKKGLPVYAIELP